MKLTTLKRKNIIGSLFVFSLILHSCKDQSVSKYTYTANVPIYMSYEELRSSVKSEPAKDLTEPGKIFYKGNYIFVSDYLKGIHIIDNSIPSAPQNIGYIKVPGNIDISVKDNILYADSYTDLVAIDISDINNVQEISRMNFSFYPPLPPYNEEYMIAEADFSKGVIIGWKVETISGTGDGSGIGPIPMIGWKTTSTGELIVAGKAGSMSRFAMRNNLLYAIDQWTMKIFDVSSPSSLLEVSSTYLSRMTETIFPSEDKLFLGTQTGMLIYQVAQDGTPNYIGVFDHGRGCDPVVVEEDFAYVTLRAGNRCGDIENELHAVDISNVSQPVLRKSYSMQEPYGLAVENGILYVCDGQAGVKVYNTANPEALDLKSRLTSHHAMDVILTPNHMVVVGSNGLHQYDRSNPIQPVYLSTIPVN